MGTNFYWHTSPQHDPTCEQLHVGKQSGAGGGLCSFGLQGHRETDFGPLDSWAKWKQVMRAIPGSDIFDEYGRPYTTEGFIALVEKTTPTNRRRQYQWMLDNGYDVWPTILDQPPPITYRGDWLCADGFSFTYSEFS